MAICAKYNPIKETAVEITRRHVAGRKGFPRKLGAGDVAAAAEEEEPEEEEEEEEEEPEEEEAEKEVE